MLAPWKKSYDKPRQHIKKQTHHFANKSESESEVAQSCPTLCDPWTVAHQAPPSMGFYRQEYWSGVPLPSPGDLPDPGIKPRSPTLQADALTSAPPGKPLNTRIQSFRKPPIETQNKGIVKAMVFPVVTYQCESWTIQKAECPLKLPWTARRSNQSILQEINLEYSLKGLMLKLKLQILDAKS